MTLNEAIEYYDSLAEECRRKASIERNDYMDLRDESAECSQLSEWLAELAVLREKVNCSEIPNSSDPISRQGALDIVDDLNSPDWYMEWGAEARKRLVDLPAMQPKRRKGKWVPDDIASDIFRCSECGCDAPVDSTAGCEIKSNFCPWCGADMRGGNNDDPE